MVTSASNSPGETPLIHAARLGRLETAEYLLGHGADPSVASNMGATALHHAAGIGNDDAPCNVNYFFTFVCSSGGNIDLNRNVVFRFLDAGHIELMKLLLGKGVDVESESDAGTPLVWAAGHGQQEAVKLLLEHNAKVVGSLCIFSMNSLI